MIGGKKMFGLGSGVKEVLKKVENEMREQEIWAQELQQRVQKIEDDYENFENVLFEICQYYNDCIRCPLRTVCKFAQEGCEEVFLCENCPRLRICCEKGARGLFIYLRDSKLITRGEE